MQMFIATTFSISQADVITEGPLQSDQHVPD